MDTLRNMLVTLVTHLERIVPMEGKYSPTHVCIKTKHVAGVSRIGAIVCVNHLCVTPSHLFVHPLCLRNRASFLVMCLSSILNVCIHISHS
jgi:hypothetical protein